MKSIADLEAIRKQMLDKITLRKEDENEIRIVVGMATCGIAAGARPVMTAFMEEVAKRSLPNVTISQTGCIGLCQLEPIVEIFAPGKEKVTYVNMTPEKAIRVVAEHIVNGQAIKEFTIGANE